ncbi:hypothetical protein GTU79_14655 [Sodalis ligni]|uniref:Uncharacterized protein n=1 Tax=Sodalis ligni TaxID=2697027 RepID=A0A4R1NDD7_9GAMM|nr:hypothetical protein [Sodalis ligni]QWA13690.1 hypothetical protein GTU79_14655 [Sodalis ligni]TCL02606.1 hypothetical protein EZJ58_0630 [Sodalis ligni]
MADQRPGIAADLMLACRYMQRYAFSTYQCRCVVTVNGDVYGRAIGGRCGDISNSDQGFTGGKIRSGFIGRLICTACQRKGSRNSGQGESVNH